MKYMEEKMNELLYGKGLDDLIRIGEMSRDISTSILSRFANGLDTEGRENLVRFVSDTRDIQVYEESPNFDPNNKSYIDLKKRLIKEYLEISQAGGENE